MAKLEVLFGVERAGPALREFALLVGHSELVKSLDKVASAVDRRRVVSDALHKRYAIPIGLRRAYQYMKSTGRSPSPLKDPRLYVACTFAIAAVGIAALLSSSARARLVGMLRDSLSLQGDARRLQHEFSVAAHFSQHEWDLTFVDLEGLGNFDYVFRRGTEELEVECKTISGDKGNPIHMLDAINLMEVLGQPLLNGLGDGLWTVDITFEVGVKPRNPQDQAVLAQSFLARALQGPGQLDFSGGLAIIRREPMPVVSDSRELHDLAVRRVSQLQEERYGYVCAFYTMRRLVIVSLSSLQPSKMVQGTYHEVKKACEQLSGTRAGVIWTHFVDISDDEMRQLGDSAAPTGLDAVSSRIFKGETRRHVSMLGYSAEPVVRERVQTGPNTRINTYMQQGLLKTHKNLRAMFPIGDNTMSPIRVPGLTRPGFSGDGSN